MKALVLTLIILTMLSTLSQADPVKNRSAQPHLKYFGYYHADGFWGKAPGFLNEIGKLKNSNVAVVNSHYEKADMRLVLETCRKYGIKAWVNAYDCFFEWNPKRVGNVKMFPDWKERWGALKEKIRGNEGDVLGFYFDEPYWNGVREEDFTLATRTIRSDYPQKRVMACLTVCELDPARWKPDLPEVSASYHKYCTDGAFDYYAAWDGAYYKKLLERLKEKMTCGQDLWLIPWAFTRGTPETSPEVLEGNIRGLYTLAEGEPRCVGLIPFSFSSGDKADWGSGCSRMFDPESKLYSPDLKRLHIRMGRSIILGLPYR